MDQVHFVLFFPKGRDESLQSSFYFIDQVETQANKFKQKTQTMKYFFTVRKGAACQIKSVILRKFERMKEEWPEDSLNISRVKM